MTTLPISICLEQLDADPARATRFMQCVAVAGGTTGLGLSRQGEICWKQAAIACELLADDDEARLLARRVDGDTELRVERAGRQQILGSEPMPLLDQDLLVIAGRRLRVHIHGPTAEVTPPSPVVSLRRPTVGADLIAVRDHPPKQPGGVVPGTGAVGNLLLILVLVGTIGALVYYLLLR